MTFLAGCSAPQKTNTKFILEVNEKIPELQSYDYCENDADCILVGNICGYFSVNKEADYEDYKDKIPKPPIDCKNTAYTAIMEQLKYCEEHPCDSLPLFCENNKCGVKFSCGSCDFVKEKYVLHSCDNPSPISTTYCNLLSGCDC